MKKKKIGTIWGLTLLITGVCSLVLALSDINGGWLPLWLTRTLGIVLIICFPAVIYTTARYVKSSEPIQEDDSSHNSANAESEILRDETKPEEGNDDEQ